MRVAAIDIGTNTVLLTIAEASPNGPRAVLERATITRLGAGVDRTRTLADAAKSRTLSCLEEYSRLLSEGGVSAVDVVGTSALRDAAGSEDFLEQARALLGVRPRVISGEEEAQLTFHGAISGLELGPDVTVFDIGGGSTEIIVRGEGRELDAKSLDIGSVRLFERHLHGDPATAEELGRVRDAVRSALANAPEIARDSTLVGVAGTITTLAAIDQALPSYDPARVHGALLTRAALDAILTRLARATLEQRRHMTGLPPGRADVIVAGAVIATEIMSWARAGTIVVSDRGVRWGLIQELLER